MIDLRPDLCEQAHEAQTTNRFNITKSGTLCQLEQEMGFEPTTFSLATRCSTTELHLHGVANGSRSRPFGFTVRHAHH